MNGCLSLSRTFSDSGDCWRFTSLKSLQVARVSVFVNYYVSEGCSTYRVGSVVTKHYIGHIVPRTSFKIKVTWTKRTISHSRQHLCYIEYCIYYSSAKGMKESALSTGTGTMTMYCNKVFGAWDYCISHEKTARLKHKSVMMDIRVCYLR